jgi:hypothetical protein
MSDFEEKAADILGLYIEPPQHAAVFCVDEKTAIQALDRLDPVLPLLLIQSLGQLTRHQTFTFKQLRLRMEKYSTPIQQDTILHLAEFEIENDLGCASSRDLNTTTLSTQIMNSGVKFRRATGGRIGVNASRQIALTNGFLTGARFGRHLVFMDKSHDK